MSATLVPFFQPIISQQGLERFGVEDKRTPSPQRGTEEPRPVDETAIHEEIQSILAQLELEVLRAKPGVHSRAEKCGGKNPTLHWWLSSRAFDRGEDDENTVVVGVSFEYRGPVVVVTGDITIDPSGEVPYDCAAQLKVDNNHTAVRGAGLALAKELAAQAKVVADALETR